MDTLFLNEQRCHCGKLLLKGVFFDAALEIKCKKCGLINNISNIGTVSDCKNSYFLIINNEGFITKVNSSACSVLGYSFEELIGKHFTDVSFMLSKDICKKFCGLNSLLNNDNYFQLDTEQKTKDGKIIPVTITIRLYQPTIDDNFVFISVVLKNENDILDKENSNFIDNSCDFYFDIDKTGLGEYVSPQMEKIFGISKILDVGKTYFDFIPDEKKLEIKSIFHYFSEKGLPYRILNHKVLSAKDGIVCVDLYFTPNFNNMNKFIGYRVSGWVADKS